MGGTPKGRWMVYFKENHHLKWRMTGGIPIYGNLTAGDPDPFCWIYGWGSSQLIWLSGSRGQTFLKFWFRWTDGLDGFWGFQTVLASFAPPDLLSPQVGWDKAEDWSPAKRERSGARRCGIPDRPEYHERGSISGWWFGCHFLLSHILGISSSQLTILLFRGVAQPPTRYGCDGVLKWGLPRGSIIHVNVPKGSICGFASAGGYPYSHHPYFRWGCSMK